MTSGGRQLDDSQGGDAKFFFVTGQARSGTNWTCALLNLHPKISCHGEYHFERLREGVDRFIGNPNALGAHEPTRSLVEDWFRRFVREALLTQRSTKPDAVWFGDRTPRELEVYLDGAPSFLVIRDGRDVVVSRAHHQMRMGGPWGEPHESRMSEHAAAFRQDPDYFNRSPERLFADHEYLTALVDSWVRRMERDLETVKRLNDQGEAPARIVRYERLHDDPEGERQAMYRFLGLDPSEAQSLSKDTHTTPGFDLEDPHSLRRRGSVGDWRRFATDEFRRIWKERAGDMLVRLEYERDLNW